MSLCVFPLNVLQSAYIITTATGSLQRTRTDNSTIWSAVSKCRVEDHGRTSTTWHRSIALLVHYRCSYLTIAVVNEENNSFHIVLYLPYGWKANFCIINHISSTDYISSKLNWTLSNPGRSSGPILGLWYFLNSQILYNFSNTIPESRNSEFPQKAYVRVPCRASTQRCWIQFL